MCDSKAIRLYNNKVVDGKRRWNSVAWYCTNCSYIYQVVSDTLIYKIGDEPYKSSFLERCPKCSLKLVRVSRHINPKEGKQKWSSMGYYCGRCKYVWIDEKHHKNID